jgi:NAD(P)-dependent dehydrogenase (short-subunit alcohol dehydrogenase family)
VNDFDQLFAVNVREPFFLVQQLAPIMGSGGSVVLVSSLAARAAFGTLATCGATKGAIDTLVKHFALTLAYRGDAVARRATNRRDAGRARPQSTRKGAPR